MVPVLLERRQTILMVLPTISKQPRARPQVAWSGCTLVWEIRYWREFKNQEDNEKKRKKSFCSIL